MTQIKSNNKAIWIGGFSTVLATFQLVILRNYLVIFLREDLLTAITIITVIVSLRNFLQLFFRVPFGELSQIIGRKPLIISGHFSITLSLVLMSVADSWHWVLLSIMFVAIGMSAFWPCILAYLSDFASDNSFGGGNIGRIFQMADLGSLFGLLISSLVLDELVWKLTDLFGIAAGIAFVFGLVNIIILPEGLEITNKKQVSSIPKAIFDSFFSMLSSLKKMTLTKELTQAYIYQLLVSFVEFTAATFIPLLIVQKGFSRGDVSEIGLWVILVSLWFKPFLGRLTDKFTFTSVITTTLIVYSFALIIFTIEKNFLLLIIIYIFMNLSLVTAYMAENNEVSRKAPLSYKGTALGALGFYVSLGRTGSTIISGPIWEFLDLISVFYIISFAIIIITLILFILNRRKTLRIVK
ncbi:MAG: MFS transporter [Promethearchaeota archaeon]